HFLIRKEDLDQFTYSLLRIDDADLAHELYLQIEAGEADFTALAKEYSQGLEKSSHGLVGPASLSRAHPLLRQRLRTAPPGVLLEPFKIEQWWVVTRLEERHLATFNANMQKQMAIELFDTWVDQQTNELISGLQQDQLANGSVS
ncbi:MAG: peptidylprolyl isomerase, partial [Prochlorococcus sp.]